MRGWVGVAVGAALLLGAQSSAAQTDGPGLWTPTASMATPRAGHTATLLDGTGCATAPRPEWCGKVLVVGGSTDAPNEDPPNVADHTAELYDPKTGTWELTGSLKAGRLAHTATLLPDGKVLVTGGRKGDSAGAEQASTELYDPDTGTWSSCTQAAASATCPGPMLGDRYDHTATLLDDGTVLLVGAATDPASEPNEPSAEIYDPASGTWSETGALYQNRYQHTATRLANGKVLVTGGTLPFDFGGPEETEIKVSTEIYDPGTGTWNSCHGGAPAPGCPGDLGQGRAGHTATTLADGRILAAGGTDLSSNLQSAELYNPATGAWSITKLLDVGRYGHAATLLASGNVLAAGGMDASFSSGLASTETFNPRLGGTRWSTGRGLNAARGSDFNQPRSVQAVLLSSRAGSFGADPAVCGTNCGRVLIVGGLEAGLFTTLASAELYTPAPTLTGLSPARGPSSGGTTVTITGSDFRFGTTAVTFGGTPARSFRVLSDTRIVAVAPAHAAGSVALGVTSQGGTSTRPFTFVGSAVRSLAGCPRARAARNLIALTAGSDRRPGTPLADLIFAGAGNDRIDGLAGDDCIDLGPGSDRGKGGRGNDFLLGGTGRDSLQGDSGNDKLLGRSGNDRITGSRGRDRIGGGAGRDRISGGASADRIAGDSDADRISGGSGRDRIRGNAGNDRISARDGSRDRISCGAGRDRVRADRADRVSRSCERVRRR